MVRTDKFIVIPCWTPMTCPEVSEDCLGRFCTVATPIPLEPVSNIPQGPIAIADALGRWGYVSNGMPVFPIQYDRTLEVLVKYAGVQVNNRVVFTDKDGHLFPVLSRIGETSIGGVLTAYRHNDGWVLRTQSDEVITHFHDFQAYFHEGLALLELSDGWSYLDKNGRIILCHGTGPSGPFSEDRAQVFSQGHWGFIDKKGQLVVPPNYNFAWSFREGLAAVNLDNRWAYIDSTGKTVIAPQFADARCFSGGLARVSTDNRFGFQKIEDEWVLMASANYGFVDRSGNYIINPQYKEARDFTEGLAAIRTDDGWGYVDACGKVSVLPTFDDAAPFACGLGRVRLGKAEGFISPTGHTVIKPQFSQAFDFSEELAAADSGSGWGFIDTTGKWAISPIFTDLSPFRCGLARAGWEGKYGYIDRKGNWAIQPQYEEATTFSEELALVRKKHTRVFIHLTGSIAFEVPLNLSSVSDDLH